MATLKAKNLKFEQDVDRLRLFGNCRQALEVLRSVPKAPYPQYELTIDILRCEAEVDDLLRSHPDLSIGQESLARLHEQTTALSAINDAPLDVRLAVAKASYVSGQFDAAVAAFDDDQLLLKNCSIHRPLMARNIAEAFALKALCGDRLGSVLSSCSFAPSDDFKAYENSWEALLYMIEGAALLDLSAVATTTDSFGNGESSSADGGIDKLGYFLGNMLHRLCLLSLAEQGLSITIRRFRQALAVVRWSRSLSLMQALARELAELLLYRISSLGYEPPVPLFLPTQPGIERPIAEAAALRSSNVYLFSIQPRNSEVFVPRTAAEEATLLLLIAERLATSRVVLTRGPKDEAARAYAEYTQQQVLKTLNPLAICCGRIRQALLLSGYLENAFRFAHNNTHLWTQLALSLTAAGRYERAALSWAHLIELQPDLPFARLQLARICLKYLWRIEKAIDSLKGLLSMFSPNWAKGSLVEVDSNDELVDADGLATPPHSSDLVDRLRQSRKSLVRLLRTDSRRRRTASGSALPFVPLGDQRRSRSPSPEPPSALLVQQKGSAHTLSPLAHTMLAYSYCVKSADYSLQTQRKRLLTDAEALLRTAREQDPNDARTFFYSAYVSASLNRLAQAKRHWEMCLYLNPSMTCCKHLVVLAMTAHNRFDDALQLLDAALLESRDDLSLLYSKSVLLNHLNRGAEAIEVALRMRDVLEQRYGQSDPLSRSQPAGPTVPPLLVDLTSASAGNNDILELGLTKYKYSGAYDALNLFGGAASASVHHNGTNINQFSNTDSQIYVHLGELCLANDRCMDAEHWLLEAKRRAPLSFHVLLLEGRIKEQRGQVEEAVALYESATALCPQHTQALLSLADNLCRCDRLQPAKRLYQLAAELSPDDARPWYSLAQVYMRLGNSEQAFDCDKQAVRVEHDGPVLPYSTTLTCLF